MSCILNPEPLQAALADAAADPRPEWGLTASIPAGTALSWGARAIFSTHLIDEPERTPTGKIKTSKGRPVTRTVYAPSVDLLWDRMGWNVQPTSDDERTAMKTMGEWIDSIGLPAIKALLKRFAISPSDDERVMHSCNGYTIVANPNGSYGYLYLAAWRL